jgi:hypothetical protein
MTAEFAALENGDVSRSERMARTEILTMKSRTAFFGPLAAECRL